MGVGEGDGDGERRKRRRRDGHESEKERERDRGRERDPYNDEYRMVDEYPVGDDNEEMVNRAGVDAGNQAHTTSGNDNHSSNDPVLQTQPQAETRPQREPETESADGDDNDNDNDIFAPDLKYLPLEEGKPIIRRLMLDKVVVVELKKVCTTPLQNSISVLDLARVCQSLRAMRLIYFHCG